MLNTLVVACRPWCMEADGQGLPDLFCQPRLAWQIACVAPWLAWHSIGIALARTRAAQHDHSIACVRAWAQNRWCEESMKKVATACHLHCHAMPCHDMPSSSCHAMPCHDMPCHAIATHAYVIPGHRMPCHAFIVAGHIISCIPCTIEQGTACHAMSHMWTLIKMRCQLREAQAQEQWLPVHIAEARLALSGKACLPALHIHGGEARWRLWAASCHRHPVGRRCKCDLP